MNKGTLENFTYDIPFSGYKSANSNEPIQTSFLQEMESIQNGDYKKEVEQAQSIMGLFGKVAYDEHRLKNVWCFTAGVNNSKQGKADPKSEDITGLLTLDIDDESQDQNRNKEVLVRYPWVLAVGKSIGGKGLFAIIKCDKNFLRESHASAIRILSHDGIIIAIGQDNANRIRYASYDPEIYFDKTPAMAPCVPLIPKESGEVDNAHIFETIVKIKSKGILKWEIGNRHENLIPIISWCNAIGMTEKFCLEMADRYCRPLMIDGNNYDIESQVRDIYSRYKAEYNTKEWKGENEDQIKCNSLDDFEKYRITGEKQIPETPAMILIGSAKVAAACNITPITAEAKAGKTAATSVFLAGAISKTGEIEGFTDLYITPNPEGKAVIHFDTEQSESDQQYNLRTILKRAKINETPANYLSYNIRTLPLNQYQEFTSTICRLSNEQFNGIHLIVIDGGADFISSVNDEEEANAIILFFTQLAVKYNCPVILVVHLNENAGRNGDTMPRGHVGRQAVRKGYAQLNIIKDGDTSIMQALRARKAGSTDTPLVCFKYDKDKGYHVSVDADTIKETREEKRDLIAKGKLEKLAEKVFPAPTSLTYTEAWQKIRKITNKSEATAKRYIKDMDLFEMVKHEDEYYRLNLPYYERSII